MQLENIYGIPNEREKNVVKIKKLAKEKVAKLKAKSSSLKDAYATFSKSLKKDDLDKLLELKTDLIENDNVPREQVDKLKVNTNSLYHNGFSFPEVAKNDFASELFDELEIAEKNFNANMDNIDLYKAFIQTCDKVKDTLKNKYGDQWTDP